MKTFLLFFSVCVLLFSCQSGDQRTSDKKSDKDFLQVPGPFTLIEKPYYFAWSSHPASTYYKQEYFPKGTDPIRYSEMIIVEVAIGDTNRQDIAVAKAKEINSRKTSDPVAAYNLGQNKYTNEVLLDFIMSEGDGESRITEWNFYRYKSYTDAKGRKGVALFGWSRRVYGNAYTEFAEELKSNRKQYVIPFMDLPFPEVQIK